MLTPRQVEIVTEKVLTHIENPTNSMIQHRMPGSNTKYTLWYGPPGATLDIKVYRGLIGGWKLDIGGVDVKANRIGSRLTRSLAKREANRQSPIEKSILTTFECDLDS